MLSCRHTHTQLCAVGRPPIALLLVRADWALRSWRAGARLLSGASVIATPPEYHRCLGCRCCREFYSCVVPAILGWEAEVYSRQWGRLFLGARNRAWQVFMHSCVTGPLICRSSPAAQSSWNGIPQKGDESRDGPCSVLHPNTGKVHRLFLLVHCQTLSVRFFSRTSVFVC